MVLYVLAPYDHAAVEAIVETRVARGRWKKVTNLEEANEPQLARINRELEAALADRSTMEQEIDRLARPLPHERAAGDAEALQKLMTEWITIVQKATLSAIATSNL